MECVECIANRVQQVTTVFVFILIDVPVFVNLHINHVIDSVNHRRVKEYRMMLKDGVSQDLAVADSRVDRRYLHVSIPQL